TTMMVMMVMTAMTRAPKASCWGWPVLSLLAPVAVLVIAIAGAGACRFDGSGLGPVDGGRDAPLPADMDHRDLATILPPDFVLILDVSSTGSLFKISNVPSTYLTRGEGHLELGGKGLSFDTTDAILRGPQGPINLPPHTFRYADEHYAVLVTGTFHLQKDAVLKVLGPRPLIIVASQKVSIEGFLDASGAKQRPGAGGGRGGDKRSPGQAGMGSGCAAGGEEGSERKTFDATGAAGGSFGGVGGHGGDGPEGAAACAPQYLVPLVGGSGGGGGAREGGTGGGGGGAIQISAGVAIKVTATGTIHAGGGGGCHGRKLSIHAGPGSGGGGGSGGAILLEAPMVWVDGRLAANGGGGGGGVSGLTGTGTDGEDAKVKGIAQGGAGGKACCNPRAGHGGAGSINSQPNGDNGTYDAGHGGGGGGGAGSIHIATLHGLIKGTPAGISPPATTGKVTPLAASDGDSTTADAGRD
ncbi:MAG: hypothetical protein KAI47_09160, partial [Deltaproteobacteria bacterium]|nr:hypothetical protein [Deltaproteobacteria bacterium]